MTDLTLMDDGRLAAYIANIKARIEGFELFGRRESSLVVNALRRTLNACETEQARRQTAAAE